MTLRLIPFRSRADLGWDRAWALYEAAFPRCERWAEEAYDRAFEDPAFEADAICCDGEPAGILFHWQAGAFRYVEHLAVRPELRGRNIGSRALELLCRGRRVILEIDPPQDEVSRRRERFYLANGMCPSYAYEHVHPSFRPTTEPHRLFLLSHPRPLTEAEFRAFQRFNNERVLSYSERK